MTKLLAAPVAAVLLSLAGTAFAGQPLNLSDSQLDQVTAGGSTNLATILVAGQVTNASVYQSGRTNGAVVGEVGGINRATVLQTSHGGSGFEFVSGSTVNPSPGTASIISTITVSRN